MTLSSPLLTCSRNFWTVALLSSAILAAEWTELQPAAASAAMNTRARFMERSFHKESDPRYSCRPRIPPDCSLSGLGRRLDVVLPCGHESGSGLPSGGVL